MDARTIPLVILQSRYVYLAVADGSHYFCDSSHSAVDIGKVNSSQSHIDITFEQLLIHLVQIQHMLVSVVAIFNSLH